MAEQPYPMDPPAASPAGLTAPYTQRILVLVRPEQRGACMDGLKGEKRKGLRALAVLSLVAVAAFAVVLLLGGFRAGGRRLTARKLRCVVSQQVTPFGDRLLYYDGNILYCLSSSGAEQWKYMLGPEAGFSVSDHVVVVWVNEHLHILDRNGRATYNDRLADTIQFARAGSRYVAAVVGGNIGPSLLVKDLNGLAVDSESVAYEDRMILDLGFFENGEYLWTTVLDVYGVAPQTVMNIYRVGAMNTGEVELGEEITYAVVYAAKKLHVINTREINMYDYRGTKDAYSTQLVYGWQLIDSQTGGDSAVMLFAPALQTAGERDISELRVLRGQGKDSRYTLPDTCVGACIRGSTLLAFSSDSLYRAEISAQRFSALKLPMDREVTGYLGKLSNGVALVSCGEEVYAVNLP